MFFMTRKLIRNVIKTVVNPSIKVSKAFCTNRIQLENLRRSMMDASQYRENPAIMKLDSPEFKSIFTPELEALVDLFKRYEFEIRIAGGAVRDLLMEKAPKDLDFATTATPDQMKELFTKENIRMINMKGEKHGTITPRINDKENFEVTTLRIDVTTDGRHAEVQFTTDWLLDANRRDLTINSMFLGLDGTVFDYFYGYEDLKARRIRFVGSAEKRIQEDYLRILRYFRFYGRIAEKPDQHEIEILGSISRNASGLAQVSGERIWTELKKILEGSFAGELMQTIIECNVAGYCGLNPDKIDLEEFIRVYQRSGHLNLNAITLLSALLRDLDDAAALHARLKLSAFERDLAVFVVEHRDDKPHEKPLVPYQQLLLKAKSSGMTREWILEVLKYRNSDLLEEFRNWQVPRFPISGNMLKECGVSNGKMMGLVLEELRSIWAEDDFKSSPEDLLNKVPEVLALLNDRRDARNKR